MPKPKLILASASIGRKQLLQKLGVPFEVMVSAIDEENITHPDPYKMLSLRARAKAEDVAEKLSNHQIIQLSNNQIQKKIHTSSFIHHNSFLIVAADSMAILDGKTFGKAKNRADTKRIVTELMGHTHDFVTATSIIYLKSSKLPKIPNRWDNIISTKVTFRRLTKQSLTNYISRFDFTRFAAGYALNETPWDLVTKIDGSYTNVVGLPFEVILPIFQKLHLLD